MAIGLYMDVHVPRAVTIGLRKRGVDVMTAQEDHTHTWSDAELLDRALELARLFVTQDVDLLLEASRRRGANLPFASVIYGHQLSVSVASMIQDLEIVALVAEEDDARGEVIFLPLK